MDAEDSLNQNMEILVKLRRDEEMGKWKAEAYADVRTAEGSICHYLGGTDEPIYDTRKQAALAMCEVVSRWVAAQP